MLQNAIADWDQINPSNVKATELGLKKRSSLRGQLLAAVQQLLQLNWFWFDILEVEIDKYAIMDCDQAVRWYQSSQTWFYWACSHESLQP
jgi:hypothetical protein